MTYLLHDISTVDRAPEDVPLTLPRSGYFLGKNVG